jgi:hypothetical protein
MLIYFTYLLMGIIMRYREKVAQKEDLTSFPKQLEETTACIEQLKLRASNLQLPEPLGGKVAVTAAVQFDDASVAEQAITEFSQMRCMQDMLEDDLKVRVGLMDKQRINWASIFFAQEYELALAGPDGRIPSAGKVREMRLLQSLLPTGSCQL